MSENPTARVPFYLNRTYDSSRADSGTRSRYGNYLIQRRSTFVEIAGWGYDDPSVEFAAAAWRIANGPIMAPPFVVSHRRVLSAELQRSDWNGEAILNVDLISTRPPALSNWLTAGGRRYYRDWRTDYAGDYEGVGDRDVMDSPYMLTRTQVLLQLPAGTLPRVTEIPTGADKTQTDRLLDLALDCLVVVVRELNKEIGPIIEQLDR